MPRRFWPFSRPRGATYAERDDCHHGTCVPPPSIRVFLTALFASWFVRMSGPLSVPLAVAAMFVPSEAAKVILGITAFACVWAASYAIWSRERIERNKSESEARDSENRLRELISAPEVTLAADKAPLIFEREAVPEAAGRPHGILIAFRDLKIINRSSQNLSIGFNLRIWLRPGFY